VTVVNKPPILFDDVENLVICMYFKKCFNLGAAKKVAGDVLDRALDWPRNVSQRLVEQSKETIARGLSGLYTVSKDPHSALDAFSDRLTLAYRNILATGTGGRKSSVEAKRLTNEEVEDTAFNAREPSIRDVERIIVAEEEQIRIKEELLAALRRNASGFQDRKPIKVKHVDSVQVTLTMLLDPPPPYIMRPPPALYRDLVRQKHRLMREIQRRGDQVHQILQRFRESDPGHVLLKLAQGERYAAFDDTTVSTADGAVYQGVSAGKNATLGAIAENSVRSLHCLHRSSQHKTTNIAEGDESIDEKKTTIVSIENENADAGIQMKPFAAGVFPNDDDLLYNELNSLEEENVTPRKDSVVEESIRIQNEKVSICRDAPNLEDEFVHVSRIMNKRSFDGFLHPEDLIPKAFRV
jgi:hypothetical protein